MHSASKVNLKLDSTDHMLKVSLKDNGRGFDNKKEKKGIGHKNITSRVHKLNGEWSIREQTRKGNRGNRESTLQLLRNLKIQFGLTEKKNLK